MRGFTLIELMITLVVLAVIITLGMPSFSLWAANGRVRMVAESLQNDMRQAQAEAGRRNRQVALILTDSAPSATPVAAAKSARNWSVRALPLLNSDDSEVSDSGATTFILGNAQNAESDVTVKSDESVLCFNSVGRLVAPATTIADAGGVACTAPTNNVPRYFRVQNATGDRPLWVQVYLGGQIRMCDPNKTLPAPDACCSSACCGLTSESSHCID
jgi:type IV fimbrial biogenesis protein FimT